MITKEEERAIREHERERIIMFLHMSEFSSLDEMPYEAEAAIRALTEVDASPEMALVYAKDDVLKRRD